MSTIKDNYERANNIIDLQDLVNTMEELEWRMDHGQQDKYEELYKQIAGAIEGAKTAIKQAQELLNNEEIPMDEEELYYQ